MSELRRIEATLLAAIERFQRRAPRLTRFERIKLRSLLRNLRVVRALLALEGREAAPAASPHHHAPGDLCQCGACHLPER